MRSIQELRIRRAVCDQVIRTLLLECQGDPRQPEALERYQAQLMKLDAELTEAEQLDRKARGIPEPKPVVIGLKAGCLSGKVE